MITVCGVRGANPEASFVDWLYRNTERAMGPFRAALYLIEDIAGQGAFDPLTPH